jgi:SEC-C motif-containing protein
MSDTNICPCGSKLNVDVCCLPLIQGVKQPLTAESLLRARYTAFTRGDVDYILNTHHSKTRHEVKKEEIEEWSKNSDWLGLKIVQIEAGLANDTQGNIVFGAHYRSEGKEQEHWEKSFFEKENNEWRFLDAKGVQLGTHRRTEPKTGRNDLCACGSGKKYKKCCLSA